MMENVELLMYGFSIALTPQNLMAAFVGAVLGLVIGATPGIGSLTGVALLLPLTFRIDPTTAIIALASVYYSCMYGSSFSSILLNIPGDTPAIVTAIDGYPMARKGQAGRAMATAITSSFFGCSVGIVVLTLSGPLLAAWGLAFGPAELCLLVIFALTSIAWVLGDNPAAGLASTGIGIIVATVGVDKAVGGSRYDFGVPDLLSGIPFIPLIVGLFGFTQVIDMVVNAKVYKSEPIRKVNIRDAFIGWQDLKDIFPTLVRCSSVAVIIGVMPGAGPTAATFINYAMEKRFSKFGHLMGTGHPVGVASGECSSNAAAAGAFAPLLTLGIPGGGTTAVLLGGLMMWGLQPGPLLFKDRPDFVWGLISSMYLANVICLVVAYAAIPMVIRVMSVPTGIMIPVVSVICMVGAYTGNGSIFDILVMVLSGLIGYFIILSKIPTAPLLLAVVLLPMLESYTRQAFDISRGRLGIFYQSTMSQVFLALIILITVLPLTLKIIRKAKNKNNGDSAEGKA